MGRSRSLEIYTLSSALNEVATTPGSVLTVKYTSLIGPRISSTLPTWDLFSRLRGQSRATVAAHIQDRRVKVRDVLRVRARTQHVALDCMLKRAKRQDLSRRARGKAAAAPTARAESAAATTTATSEGHDALRRSPTGSERRKCAARDYVAALSRWRSAKESDLCMAVGGFGRHLGSQVGTQRGADVDVLLKHLGVEQRRLVDRVQ